MLNGPLLTALADYLRSLYVRKSSLERPAVTSRPLRPHFSFDDRTKLLRSMEAARTGALMFGGSEGYGSRQWRLCDALREAIDALAGDLTGDPTHFHAKPHGGGH